MTELQEARLLGRAINSRWSIPQETKADVIETLQRIAVSGIEESSRIAACRALIAAEGQNQRDEHEENSDIRRRILELAAQYGIGIVGAAATAGGARQSIERSQPSD